MTPLEMLTHTDLFAVVAKPNVEFDPVKIRKGQLVYPTEHEAIRELEELRGEVHCRRQFVGGPTRRVACVVQFKLPHCWLYDTEPVKAGVYQLGLPNLDNGEQTYAPTEAELTEWAAQPQSMAGKRS